MKKHAIEIRVRYAETDQMAVVYYANYLVWFEIARTEFFREKGLEYKKLEEEDKLYLPVVEAYCKYMRSLRYDDLVTITTDLTEVGPARITFEYEVLRAGEIVATGKTRHAFVNKAGKPVSVPSKVKEALATILPH